MKIPLYVELIGEPSTGKSHFSYLFPKPAVIDTTVKKEGRVVLRKFYPDWEARYFPVWSIEDVRKAIKAIQGKRDFFRTVVFDTAADLRDLGAEEFLKEESTNEKKRRKVMPEEWGIVDDKINKIIDIINSEPKPQTSQITEYLEMNIVMVAQMKDEWGGDRKPTGKRIRKGFPKANFQSDIRLYFTLEPEIDPKSMLATGKAIRVVKVIKNRFKDMASGEWVSVLNPVDWKTLIEKLTDLKEGEIVQ